MPIFAFMRGYKQAWEERDEARFAALFVDDGVYHNTPFAQQRGHAALRAYWQRVKLQQDVAVDYEVLAAGAEAGMAHWRTTYQVASEELFAVWAASAGTHLPPRQPGDALPRMVLDGVLRAEFEPDGRCRVCRIWWHSRPDPG